MKNLRKGIKFSGTYDIDTRIKLVGYVSKMLFLTAVGIIVFLLTSKTIVISSSVEQEPLEWNSTVQTGPPMPEMGF